MSLSRTRDIHKSNVFFKFLFELVPRTRFDASDRSIGLLRFLTKIRLKIFMFLFILVWGRQWVVCGIFAPRRRRRRVSRADRAAAKGGRGE